MYNRMNKYNRKLRVGRKKIRKKNKNATHLLGTLEYFNNQSANQEYLQIMFIH